MQTTQNNAGKIRANSYFRQRAESLRRQLDDVEIERTKARRDAKLFTDVGQSPPPDVAERLRRSERKAKEVRNEMERALFNAGRA